MKKKPGKGRGRPGRHRDMRPRGGALPVIACEIAGQKYSVDPNVELSIDRARLDEELAQQPSRMAWIGVLSEMADSLERRMEYEVDVLRSKLDPEVRRMDPDLTEAAVKAAIIRSPRFKERRMKELRAKELAGKLRSLVFAYRGRSFALRELSTRDRHEEASTTSRV